MDGGMKRPTFGGSKWSHVSIYSEMERIEKADNKSMIEDFSNERVCTTKREIP